MWAWRWPRQKMRGVTRYVALRRVASRRVKQLRDSTEFNFRHTPHYDFINYQTAELSKWQRASRYKIVSKPVRKRGEKKRKRSRAQEGANGAKNSTPYILITHVAGQKPHLKDSTRIQTHTNTCVLGNVRC